MKKTLRISKIIKPYKKVINVEGDKSLSIIWVLLASLSQKKSISIKLIKALID